MFGLWFDTVDHRRGVLRRLVTGWRHFSQHFLVIPPWRTTAQHGNYRR